MPVTLDIYTYVYKAHKVLSCQPLIFYTCKPSLFFHIYDPFSIPWFGNHICFSTNAYEVLTAFHKDFTFGSSICLADMFLYLCQYFLKLYTLVYIYKILMCMLCSVDSL